VGVFPTKRCVCNVEQHSQRRGVLGGKGWGLGAFESDFQFVQRLAELNHQSRMLFLKVPRNNDGGRGRVVEAGEAESTIRLGTTSTVGAARVCPGGDASE